MTGPTATPANYYADASEFQCPYDATYPYALAQFRFHSGYRTDKHAAQNWAVLQSMLTASAIRLVYAYVVFVPGQLPTVLDGLIDLFGETCPTDRLVIVIDMESGHDFAGPGNHSSEANLWAETFAEYVGTWARVDPYANQGDYAHCWPQIDARLTKHHIAAYTATQPAGAYSWQYYGATDDPSPAGAPRSCPPFGAGVDMNVIYRTTAQIEADYGITAPAPVPLGDEVALPKMYRQNQQDQPMYGAVFADLGGGVTRSVPGGSFQQFLDMGWPIEQMDAGPWNVTLEFLTYQPGGSTVVLNDLATDLAQTAAATTEGAS